MWRIPFLALFFIPKNVRRDWESVIESVFEANFRSRISFVSRGSICHHCCLFNISRVMSLPCSAGFIPERIYLKTLTWQTRIFFHTTLEGRGFGTAKSQIMMPAQDSSTFQGPQVSNFNVFVRTRSFTQKSKYHFLIFAHTSLSILLHNRELNSFVHNSLAHWLARVRWSLSNGDLYKLIPFVCLIAIKWLSCVDLQSYSISQLVKPALFYKS